MGGTVFVTGYAKLPAGITASELSRVVGIALEVEPRGRIVRADCTLATRLGREFFVGLVEGKNLVSDFGAIIQSLEDRYLGSAQKSLCVAMKTALERFRAVSPGK